jgi:hypothetical protein
MGKNALSRLEMLQNGRVAGAAPLTGATSDLKSACHAPPAVIPAAEK